MSLQRRLGPAVTQRVFGDMRWWTITCGVPAAGLAVMIEKPSRRQELGVYCASRAMEAGMSICIHSLFTPHLCTGYSMIKQSRTPLKSSGE